jgi:2-keto-4-pentenoate hydratase/2-oxohepta-3-ene-1,7-dioic acid hydratase in catechol pathway
MKICRFDDNRVGVVLGGDVYDVTSKSQQAIAHAREDASLDPLVAALSDLLAALPLDLSEFARQPLASVRLLSPVRRPGKIVGAPVNYQAHIAEMHASSVSPGHNIPFIDKAGLFLKATSSLVGPAQGIALRFPDRRTDHEIELVAVIGRTASEISREHALSYVAGYCLGLDITVRGPEDRSFRKSIDSYTVLGPWLTTADDVADPNQLRLTLRQNGEVRQDTSTGDMIFDVARLIEFASAYYTLYPGDVLFTGTPQGVGPIKPGDLLRAECPELGVMEVSVRSHQGAQETP